MSAVEIRGLEALRHRLAAAAEPQPIKSTLQGEAEAVAEEAKRAAPGELGHTVEIVVQSRGTRLAYAIGTAHRAGRFLEYGTVKMRAKPWLWPAFQSRSRGINHKVRKAVATAFKTARGLI